MTGQWGRHYLGVSFRSIFLWALNYKHETGCWTRLQAESAAFQSDGIKVTYLSFGFPNGTLEFCNFSIVSIQQKNDAAEAPVFII